MYKTFFIMMCIACVVPITSLICCAKHKCEETRPLKLWERILVSILSVVLIGLFVTAFIMMSRKVDSSIVTSVGFGIVVSATGISNILARKKVSKT